MTPSDNKPHLGSNVLTNSFSASVNDVITEAFARIRLGELRQMPIVNLVRAGAYMCSRLRLPYTMCALALNARGRYVSDKTIRIGERWDFASISYLLRKFAADTGAPYMMIGVYREVSWKDVMSLNSVYLELLQSGVKILDFIEVTDIEFLSLLNPYDTGAVEPYSEFK